MKLRTNFSRPLGRWAPTLATILWGVAFAASCSALWLVFDVRNIQPEISDLQKRLDTLNSKHPQEKIKESLPPADLAALIKTIHNINQLTKGSEWTPTTLLRRLEEILPDKAYLISANYKHKNGELLIIAESEYQSALTKFLYNLERENHFSDVLLQKQEHFRIQGKPTLRFEIYIKERML